MYRLNCITDDMGKIVEYEYVIGAYATSYKDEYSEDKEGYVNVYTNTQYYQPLYVKYLYTNGGFSFTYYTNGVRYTYVGDERSDEVIASVYNIVNVGVHYNGIDEVIVGVNNYNIVFKKVLNDCGTTYQADFTYEGVDYHAELYVAEDVITLGFSTSDNSVSGSLRLFYQNGVISLDKAELDLFGEKYELVHEATDDGDLYYVEFVADGEVCMIQLYFFDGGVQLAFNVGSDFASFTATYVDGVLGFSVYGEDDERVYIDASLLFGAGVNPDYSECVTITLDLANLLVQSGETAINGEIVKVYEDYISTFVQLILTHK
jgi:hypothetical protein